MSIDKATVARIAALARIEVPESDQERLAGELSRILDWVEQLDEVDTRDVQPMRSVMGIKRHWRPDQVADGDRQGDVVRNAPKSHDGYFVVPKVVE
jgi:aspartyl-tRNA(Asn)/glutamyl-tRNA(Gln) amidotransferase subunit C